MNSYTTNKVSRCPHLLWKQKNDTNCSSNQALSLSDKLKNINQTFLSELSYSAQSISGHHVDTVVVYKGNELSLWIKNDDTYIKKDEILTPSNKSLYTILKQVSHLSVTSTLLIDQLIENSHDQKNIFKKIELYLKSIEEINNDINDEKNKDLFKNHRERQINICTATIKFLQEILLKQPLQEEDKKEITLLRKIYLKKIESDIAINNHHAAYSQLDELATQLKQWGLNDAKQLKSTYFVVVTPHGPRKGHVTLQYLKTLCKKKLGLTNKEDKHIYYLECLPTLFNKIDIQKDVIDHYLLGSELNQTIGNNILNNKYGMFRDILEHNAPKIIDQLLSNDNDFSITFNNN